MKRNLKDKIIVDQTDSEKVPFKLTIPIKTLRSYLNAETLETYSLSNSDMPIAQPRNQALHTSKMPVNFEWEAFLEEVIFPDTYPKIDDSYLIHSIDRVDHKGDNLYFHVTVYNPLWNNQ